MNMISVFGADVGAAEIDQVSQSLQARWMGAGPKVDAFEKAFAGRLGLTDCAMVNSGSNALYLALQLLDLTPGTEVVLPSFTWISCAHAVVLCGCVPVFCDVDPRTHNLSAETVAPCITPRTGAIMVVHYAGKPAPMDELQAFGLPIVEDAAHAVDSTWRGRACGAIGEVGIFSFDPVKNLASPEGGALTARDAERVRTVRRRRYCGIEKSGFQASAGRARWWEYDILEVTHKFLPNDICAGIALAQLARLDALQRRRREIWEIYQREFAALDWLVRPVDAATDERHSYFTYCVNLPRTGDRDRLAHFLYERRIYTTLRFHPLHLNPIYRSQQRLPVSEHLSEHALNLPIHPALSNADLERILSGIRAFAPG